MSYIVEVLESVEHFSSLDEFFVESYDNVILFACERMHHGCFVLELLQESVVLTELLLFVLLELHIVLSRLVVDSSVEVLVRMHASFSLPVVLQEVWDLEACS